MKNYYVVRKTTTDGRRLFLDSNGNFCVEKCNGGVYRFTNRKTAEDSLKYANRYKWGYDNTQKDDIMTHEEYLSERQKKLDAMKQYAHEHGIETHSEETRLYIYLSTIQWGKTVATWHDVTLENIEDIAQYVNP